MFRFQGTKKALAVHSSRFFSTEPSPQSKGRRVMDFIKYYASVFALMGSTLLAVVYTASYVQERLSELKHIKEAYASEIKYIKEVHAADIKHAEEVHASEIQRIKDGFERAKEVHTTDIERAKAEAAKKAIADFRKEYQHLDFL
eukprot:gene8231-5932_t